MTWYDYQMVVRQTNQTLDAVDVHFIGLAGETGEVCSIRQKQMEGKTIDGKDELLEELGDVLWRLTAVADYYGFDLQHVAQINADKVKARHG